MNDWIATLFWVVGLGVVFLTAVNIMLVRLVTKLWRENEELQPPFQGVLGVGLPGKALLRYDNKCPTPNVY